MVPSALRSVVRCFSKSCRAGFPPNKSADQPPAENLPYAVVVVVFLVFGSIAGPIVISGCGRIGSDEAPRIRFGRDVCDECRMIISEKPHAAAARRPDGGSAKFDSIGCLIRSRMKSGLTGERTWVHDFQTGEWIPAEQAFYVYSDGIISPMGLGIAAFSTEEAARRFTQERAGRRINWNHLEEFLKQKMEEEQK